MLLLTFVVNSKRLICTYDTIDDPDNYDEFDVLFLRDVDSIGFESVKYGIEELTLEWRKKGKPSRYVTHFELSDDSDV